METETQSLPVLPCPRCNANILEKGFYNKCVETHALREHNYGAVSKGRLRIRHDEENLKLISHECSAHAFCANCDKLLPWPLFKLRSLDATPMSLSEKAIGRMLKKAEEQNANPPAETEEN